ncbi:MAG TPA: hypothetical protein ENN67_07090, partial [Firmicutes bacterium]|nr:hypothetical protein [Bacillota bacterium]
MVLKTRAWASGLVSLLFLFVISCAGGGNPVVPSSPGDNSGTGLTSGTDQGRMFTDPASGQSAGRSGDDGGTQLWGYYDVIYDEGIGEFVISPVRSAQFTFNMLGFLQPPDGNPANLEILNFEPAQFLTKGIIELDIRITHPYANPRLVGFDTYGVLIGKASKTFGEDTAVKYAGAGDLMLLNSDGYTRWMNPVEFTEPGYLGYTEGMLGTKGVSWTATINGYKYFADGLSVNGSIVEYMNNAANIEKRGAFMPGTSNTRHYVIQFPQDGDKYKIQFQYAIVSHFRGAKDANGDPIPDPELSDFPKDANANEAVCIHLKNTTGTNLFYDDNTGNAGGNLAMELTIFDWQAVKAIGGSGAYALKEIQSIEIDSPDGLFGTSGVAFTSSQIEGKQVAFTDNSTTLKLTIEGLVPQKSGPNELIFAVYNADPTDYAQPLGGVWPPDARLAAYARAVVEVNDTEPYVNYPPKITEIEGPTEVDCWDGSTEYTAIATDPNPGDELTFWWDLMPSGFFPIFLEPGTPNNFKVIDWSDTSSYPPGMFDLWCKVSDGEYEAFFFLTITVGPGELQVEPITADDEDTYDVYCTNTDAHYSTDAQSCTGGGTFMYRWLRGTGNPPSNPNPSDPNWTQPSEDNFIIYSWDNTTIGQWWIIAEVTEFALPSYSPPYLVQRIDTPPSDPLPPDGASEVDCNNTAEPYLLSGGEDCDGGTFQRQWAITQTNIPPTIGWLTPGDDIFYVNWKNYPIGTYYLWQRVGLAPNWEVSPSLEVHRNNTPPNQPQVPDGMQFVTCWDTDVEYNAGEVTDCEGDPIIRAWALGTDASPPSVGWVSFTGDYFYIDFSVIPSGSGFLFQRASDTDGATWVYSNGMDITKFNSPPTEPDIPAGPIVVDCHYIEAEYECGDVYDCDVGDIITRYWGITDSPFMPPHDWNIFTGDSIIIDWSVYQNGIFFLFQKATDGAAESLSQALEVIKLNAVPVVGLPVGPTEAWCTTTDALYEPSTIEDCDPESSFQTRYYLSTDPDEQMGGAWIPFEDEFIIDFSAVPVGD